jgi:glutathione S-transferase
MEQRAPFRLIIGDKNLSSWSLRPWLVLKHTGAVFEEELVRLDRADTSTQIQSRSPSGRVPCLYHDGNVIWDSLAICEYVSEILEGARLWPDDREARARARSLAAEMHSGFQALRTNMPMNIKADRRGEGRTEAVERDLERICAIWRGTRDRYGSRRGGAFLFGRFTIADAFFAPVVTRFRTYGVALDAVCQAYADAVWDHPPMQEWVAAARGE